MAWTRASSPAIAAMPRDHRQYSLLPFVRKKVFLFCFHFLFRCVLIHRYAHVCSCTRLRIHSQGHGVLEHIRSRQSSRGIVFSIREICILPMPHGWVSRHPVYTFQSPVLSRMRHIWNCGLHFWRRSCGYPEQQHTCQEGDF